MANIRLIRRRIKSAQNIAQITRAMEMVAASKMKKAQDIAVQSKPYAEKIYQMIRELTSRVDIKSHDLLTPGNTSGKILVVLISTNKGLCGGLNTNLFRLVINWFANSNDIDFITFGLKGRSFLARTGKNLIADFSSVIPFAQSVAAAISLIVEGFTKGVYREVYLVYNTFLSALKQQSSKKLLLPINTLLLEKAGFEKVYYEFLIEPDVNSVLSSLLPHYLENQLRSSIFEAEASEHSARMIAMKNATDAANDLMFELRLLYNKARQEKITYEIADMVTARLAVEG